MALTVNSNISSINAQRNLTVSTTALNKSLERLSSGLRINRSGDDAAGMAISEGLRSQIRGMNQAVRNANDGLSLIGTAESAMNTYTEILQRMRELAIQSANDTNSPANRQALNEEATQLLGELKRIAETVEFNGTRLLDGTFTAKQLQVGAQANQTIAITTGDLRPSKIGQIAKTTSTAVTSAALAPNDLLLNNEDIGATTNDGVSNFASTASALAKANAINAGTGRHGVTAKALQTVFTAANAIAGGAFNAGAEQLTINGIDIFDNAVTIVANDGDNTLVDAINSKTNEHGTVATVVANKLVLTAVDGRNVDVTTTGTKATALGLAGAGDVTNLFAGGRITLTAADPIAISGAAVAAAGLGVTTIALDPNLAVNNIDISTVQGSNLAIDIADNALGSINNIRAGLGATTNRLENTINNLQAIAENLAASDSRIRDADFAFETAQLTRNQILQQAGIAILSQANTTSQSALQLLQR